MTKITQQIIAKYRNRVYRRSADIIHHFLVKAEKCQGKRGMKLLVRKIKLAQRMVRGCVEINQCVGCFFTTTARGRAGSVER